MTYMFMYIIMSLAFFQIKFFYGVDNLLKFYYTKDS